MSRRLLLTLAVALTAVAALIALDQPQPDPDRFHGNPCDGSIRAAFDVLGDGDEAEPYLRECRGPARRQLALSGLLLLMAGGLVVVRARAEEPRSGPAP